MFRTLDVKINNTCSDIRQNYTDKNNFDTIKSVFETPLEQIGGITGAIYNANRTSSDPTKSIQAKQNLDALIVLENNLTKYLNCVNSDLQEYGRQASKIYKLQDELKEKRNDVKKMKEIAEEAGERSKLVTDPYSQTSYHESWFPLGRPMKKDNVPVLLAFGIFFLVFAFGMFLRLSSLDLQFTSALTQSNSFATNLISKKYQ
jgi:hypothetical protein